MSEVRELLLKELFCQPEKHGRLALKRRQHLRLLAIVQVHIEMAPLGALHRGYHEPWSVSPTGIEHDLCISLRLQIPAVPQVRRLNGPEAVVSAVQCKRHRATPEFEDVRALGRILALRPQLFTKERVHRILLQLHHVVELVDFREQAHFLSSLNGSARPSNRIHISSSAELAVPIDFS